MFRPPRRAAVLAAALHHWTQLTRDEPVAPVARLVIRQAPGWEQLGAEELTAHQVTRVLDLLRTDLIPIGPTTPLQAEAAVDQILAEWRAEGRRTVRTSDWLQVLPRIGRDRNWLAGHLTHLVDSGYLRETWRLGTYRL